MSTASSRADAKAEPRIERAQRWIATLSSALLHLLLVLLLLYAAKPTVTTPQGAASGSRTRVTFIGESDRNDPPTPEPPSPSPAQTPKPPRTPPPASRVRSTLVEQADDPVPDTSPLTRPSVPQPPSPPDDATRQAQAPGGTPPSTRRRPETWTGRPPGLIEQDTALVNAGRANSPAIADGRGRDMTDAGPSMELGGYLVYYDVLSEARLRQWKDQGMKEISIPLPGTRYYMVCPLEVALKRGSGKCRALDPYDPEMQAIGDAREAVTMLQIYKQGELVWRGPGPYK